MVALQENVEENLITTHVEDLQKYLQFCIQDIETIFAEAKEDTNLHPTRKKIKDIIYLAALANVNQRESIPVTKLQLFDDLQDVIGDLHDISIFYDSLQKISATLKISD